MAGPQVTQPQVPQVRGQVVPDVVPVRPLGRRPQPGGHLLVDPLGQVRAELAPLVVVVLADLHPGQQRGERVLGVVPALEAALLLLEPLAVAVLAQLGDVVPGAVVLAARTLAVDAGHAARAPLEDAALHRSSSARQGRAGSTYA
nr:hypothetical protein [Micromonospora sp. Mcm103]